MDDLEYEIFVYLLALVACVFVATACTTVHIRIEGKHGCVATPDVDQASDSIWDGMACQEIPLAE